MDELKEVSYRCSEDATHPTWSGIEGEIQTVCAECGAEGELVDVEIEEGETGPTGETGESELEEVPVAKYRITGLVDIFDEQRVIRGQFPIGSVQELPVEVGDAAVEDGRAERVDEDVE